jgi:hypothetical protein
MKKMIIFLWFLPFFIGACQKMPKENLVSTSNIESTNIENSLIEEISEKFAPDKRVAIYDIKLKQTDSNRYVLKGTTNLPEAKKETLKKIKEKFPSVIDSLKLLPAKELGDKIYGIVNISVANIRSEPSYRAELGTQSLLGTPVKVWDVDDDWYRIQTPDDYISWVDPSGIELVNKEELNAWLSSKRVIFLDDFGFSYEKPDEKSQRVSDLVGGCILKQVDANDANFYQVMYPDGRKGFVRKSLCKDFTEWSQTVKATPESILAEAKKMMGVPYLWGGTSKKGVDCSGFTKTAYFLNGIILMRDASQQTYTGELVDTKEGFQELKPGDLVFFGRKASADHKEKVSHVGIYMGNSEFIHSSGMVRVNSFDKNHKDFSDYRTRTLIRGRRILSSLNTKGISRIMDNPYYKIVP